MGEVLKDFHENKDHHRRINLVPFKSIVKLHYIRRKSFLWVLFFGITPLIILYLHAIFNWQFESSAWILGAYFCLIWAVNFHILVRPNRSLWSIGAFYALFTAFIGVPILLLLQNVGVIRLLYSETKSEVFLFRILGFIFGVGLLEETCKLLPILIFGIRRNRIYSLRQALFLGAMSGLGFALAEAVNYTLMYWQQGAIVSLSEANKTLQDTSTLVNNLTDYYVNIVIVQVVRFMTLPLFHAIWTGITSWYAVAADFESPINRRLIAFGVLFMAVIHGLYDVYSGTLRGIGIGIITILIFMGYLVYSEKIDLERIHV